MEYLQIQEVYGEAGFWGFWKGVLPTLIMVCKKWLLLLLREYHSLFLLLLAGEQSFYAIYAVWNDVEEVEETTVS